jgi:hypothetical protein
VPIGESAELGASVRAGGDPAWYSNAAVNLEKLGPQGAFQDYRARLTPRQPGAVKVVVEVDGKQAEAMLACVDPTTMSQPVALPSGFPRQAMHLSKGARLIQTDTAWTAFVDALRPGHPALSTFPAPVDWSRRSIVAVIHDPYLGTGPLVVTHVAPGSPVVVSLVEPRLINFGMLIYPGGYAVHAISLLEIAKVDPGATIDFVRLSDYTHETRTLKERGLAMPRR